MIALHPWWPDALAAVHPHLVFELVAYGIGAARLLGRRPDAALPVETRLLLLAGALIGAALGAKGLFLLIDPPATAALLAEHPERVLLAGRSIVGGLLGGWAGVELAKRLVGLRASTGDAWVDPLIVAMIVGRIGCFLSGVSDGTHGVPTDSWLGMDLGDGVPRHPTAAYEIGFLGVLGLALRPVRGAPGSRFRLFLLAYFGFRALVESLKTQPPVWLGLTTIQLASLLGVCCLMPWMVRSVRGSRARGHDL